MLREYAVSQMPVVQHEPPVMAAEVVGSVIERELLGTVFADRSALDRPLGERMSSPLPMVGAGEPLHPARYPAAPSAGACSRRRLLAACQRAAHVLPRPLPPCAPPLPRTG